MNTAANPPTSSRRRAMPQAKALALAACLVSLSGCVSIYKAPANAPTATLELTSTNTLFVQHFLNEKCDKSPNGSRVSFMSDVAGDPIGLAIKTIEAEKPFILAWRLNTPQGMSVMASCNITGVFEPRRNATYRASFIHDVNAKKCFVQILVKDPASGKTSIEPSFRKLPIQCANNVDG